MSLATLTGRSILVVEDQPLIAYDIIEELQEAGAMVVTTDTVRGALLLVEDVTLSAAILDHGLRDGDSSPLCARLNERGIPFILYTGFPAVQGECAGSLHIGKPAGEGMLSAALVALIG